MESRTTTSLWAQRVLEATVIVVLAWVHGQAMANAPVVSQGDPAAVYLPFARLWAEGRWFDAYGVLTTIARMPLYAHILGVVSWVTGPHSRAHLWANAAFWILVLALGARLLRRAGLGGYRWLWWLLIGIQPVVVRLSGIVLSDLLLWALALWLTDLLLSARAAANRDGRAVRTARNAGFVAGLNLLIRFNPAMAVGPAAFALGIDPRSRRLWAFAFGVAAVWIAGIVWVGAFVWPQKLFYPLIYLPASETAQHNLPRWLVFPYRLFVEQPRSLASMVMPVWLWPLVIFGGWRLIAAGGEARRLAAIWLGFVLSILWLHFEPRYQLMWNALWALAVVVAVADLHRRVLDRWNERARWSAAPIAVALAAALTLSMRPSISVQLETHRQRMASFDSIAELCDKIRIRVPPGSVSRIFKAGHRATLTCLFDSRPAYAFTDDRTATGVGFDIDLHKGTITALPPSVAPSIGPPNEQAWRTAALDKSSTPLPRDVRAPGWRFTRTFLRMRVPAGRHWLRITTQAPQLPLRGRVRIDGRPAPDWMLPADRGRHLRAVDGPAVVSIDLRPVHQKWPAGVVRIESAELAPRTPSATPERAPTRP